MSWANGHCRGDGCLLRCCKSWGSARPQRNTVVRARFISSHWRGSAHTHTHTHTHTGPHWHSRPLKLKSFPWFCSDLFVEVDLWSHSTHNLLKLVSGAARNVGLSLMQITLIHLQTVWPTVRNPQSYCVNRHIGQSKSENLQNLNNGEAGDGE